MRGMDVLENIDVSDTKLMLGLRVCFICSDLTANKLFPNNPRAVTGPPKVSLLLEVESTSALIIEPRLILVTYTDDLGGYITSNQQGKIVRHVRQNVALLVLMVVQTCTSECRSTCGDHGTDMYARMSLYLWCRWYRHVRHNVALLVVMMVQTCELESLEVYIIIFAHYFDRRNNIF